MAKRRILLVDGGDPAVGRILVEYFCLRDDFEVESVECCDDAVTALMGRPFDLLLLLSIHARWRNYAKNRARFTAIEMLKEMRAIEITVPALVVSSSMLPQAKAEVLANGAAFIPAPPDLAELDGVVARALGYGPQNTPK